MANRQHRGIALGLLILSIILMAVGGYADLSGHDRVHGISKQHLWASGTFSLVMSGWVLLWGHVTAEK